MVWRSFVMVKVKPKELSRECFVVRKISHKGSHTSVCVRLFVFGVTTGDSHDAVMGTKYWYAFVSVQQIHK